MDETLKPRNPNDLLIFQNTDNEDFQWQYDAIRTPLPYLIRAGETRELPYYLAKHGINKLIDRILQKKKVNFMNPQLREDEMDKIVLGIKHINYIREKTPNEIALESMQRKKDVDPLEELLKKREIAAEQLREQQRIAAAPAQPMYTVQGTPVQQQPAPVNAAPASVAQPIQSQPAVQPQAAPIQQQPVQPTAAPIQAAPVNPAPVNQPLQPLQQQPAAPVAPIVGAPVATPAPIETLPNPEATDPARMNVYNLLRNKLHMDLTHPATKKNLDALPVPQLVEEFKDQLPELVDPAAALVPDTRESLSQPGMPESTKNYEIPVAGTPVASAANVAAAPPPVPAAAPLAGPSTTPILDQNLNSAA